MSEYKDQQKRFAVAAARLILAADSRGIPLRFGDAWRDPRIYRIIKWAYATGYDDGEPEPKCHPRSLHFDRLAIDLIADEEAHHAELHDLWDTMSDESSPRIEGDMNHYSFARGGMT